MREYDAAVARLAPVLTYAERQALSAALVADVEHGSKVDVETAGLANQAAERMLAEATDDERWLLAPVLARMCQETA